MRRKVGDKKINGTQIKYILSFQINENPIFEMKNVLGEVKIKLVIVEKMISELEDIAIKTI